MLLLTPSVSGSIQVAAIRTGGHPAGGWLVPALLSVLPRRGRTPCRADFRSTTSPSGGGCSVTPQKFSADCDCGLRPTNDSWRVDETYIRVKGKWVYLYRAVDSTGATIDFLLSAKRDAAAAERFLAKALGAENHPAPRVINTDEHAGYPPAIGRLKAEEALEENCRHGARPVEGLGFVGLELFDVVHCKYRKIKRYCYTWNMLVIR
jgi:DDE domain